jgi:hypothetical protein
MLRRVVWQAVTTACLCLKCKKKCRLTVVPIHAMKAHRGSGGIAPLILDLGTKWRSAVNLTPRPLYSRYSLNRRLCGSHSRCGRFHGRANLLYLPEFEPWTLQPIAAHHLALSWTRRIWSTPSYYIFRYTFNLLKPTGYVMHQQV